MLLGLVLHLFNPGFVVAQNTARTDHVATAVKSPYPAISDAERLRWAIDSTIGAKSLGAGIVIAAWRTANNNPEEYGPHWEGFAKRYGIRLAGVATGNAIEVEVGNLWGEDPRYVRSAEYRTLPRLRHAAAMVFIAPRADGHLAPSYARYTGIVGSNFISNSWRAKSENGINAALTRSALGFLGKFASNVIDEFWQDINSKVRKRP